MYETLNTRKGEKKIFKIAKARQKKRQDREQVGVVKNENGQVLLNESDIKMRWKQYFEQLLNVENDREELEEIPYTEGPLNTISREEMESALKKMKTGKAPGPSEVAIELINAMEDCGKEWLLKLLQQVVKDGQIPEDWRRSRICNVFKNKGNIWSVGIIEG